EIAGRCGNRIDRTAVADIRGPVIARLDRAGTGVGPLRRAGCRCRRQPVLSGLPVTQSRHRHYRRDIPAHSTMDTARHSSNRDGGVAGVRYDGAVFERVAPPVFHRLALALIAITAALAWRRVAAGKG